MEVSGESNQQQQPSLVCKLMQGRDLARQLETQLEPSELRRSLLQQLITSIEDALLMARVGAESTPPPPPTVAAAAAAVAGVGSESPQSMSGSDHNSDQALQNCGERRDASKKRKTQPKWTNQVRVYSGNGLEAPLDDGYSWRKYGQKDILGATYPRGYYRCTHRSTRHCPAMKQVQRSDDDPSIFDITYRGTHTCQSNQSLTSTSSPRPQNNHNQDQQQPPPPQHLLLNFRTGLRVKTEDLDSHDGPPLSTSSFSFPSTPIDLPLKPENHIFSSHSPTMLTESHANFIGGASGFSSPFLSPATSESNYFSVSPCMGSFGGIMESDFTEIISAVTSTTNSPMIDLDFDSIFPFDQNFLS